MAHEIIMVRLGRDKFVQDHVFHPARNGYQFSGCDGALHPGDGRQPVVCVPIDQIKFFFHAPYAEMTELDKRRRC